LKAVDDCNAMIMIRRLWQRLAIITTSCFGLKPREGDYTALVPALPGCVTYGRGLREAREMAKDAISGYIASLRKHNDPIPTDDDTLLALLDLEYAR
jgi:antitoxin HicB